MQTLSIILKYRRIYWVTATISIMQGYPKQVIGEEEFQTLTQLLRTPKNAKDE